MSNEYIGRSGIKKLLGIVKNNSSSGSNSSLSAESFYTKEEVENIIKNSIVNNGGQAFTVNNWYLISSSSKYIKQCTDNQNSWELTEEDRQLITESDPVITMTFGISVPAQVYMNVNIDSALLPAWSTGSYTPTRLMYTLNKASGTTSFANNNFSLIAGANTLVLKTTNLKYSSYFRVTISPVAE